jgi:S-adenosylmethionine:tRNA ribosyltransferase-isomerase
MNVEDFVFHLPEELIASHPAERRDGSRLLVVRRDPAAVLEHRSFSDLPEYLQPGDLLVMNNSRVIPARLAARRATGGKVEILLLSPVGEAWQREATWRALVRPAKKIDKHEVLTVLDGLLTAEVIAEHDAGERTVRFHAAADFRELLDQAGQMPLPPYILKRRTAEHAPLYDPADRERYQTIYAKPEGSVAAPTAGLHFTPELLARLRAGGVETAFVTLHVGAGTFQGMAEGTRVEDHQMHFEEYEVPAETAAAVNRARAEGRRVVAVGTTSVRTLESAADPESGRVREGPGRTNLMITPGRHLRVVDALVTNFHLPRSTLLLLVSAFAGRERIMQAYGEAVRQKYRFFSYGDAMLLLP